METYGDAVWWTAMLLTTLGSEYWPRTAEGRVLCVLLALYAFAVFGYITATLATYFVGRDAAAAESELAGAADVRALREEIAALRADVRALRDGTHLAPPTPPGLTPPAPAPASPHEDSA